jgi:hypothetical protein
MNLKVTLTFIASEEDWSIITLLEDHIKNLSSEEAKEIVRETLLEDATYVIKNADISIKQDHNSI